MGPIRAVAMGLRLCRSRGEMPAMVVVLAAGVGLTAAAYSLVYAVLLRPLPYGEPERLVEVWAVSLEGAGTRALSGTSVTALLEAPSPFEDLAVHNPVRAELQTEAGASSVEVLGAHVSVNLFTVLRAQAATGRPLREEDDRLTNVSPIIVSETLVRSGLVSDRLGGTVSLDGVGYRLVGTMPATFWFPDRQTVFWVPILAVPPEQLDGGAITTVSPTIGRLVPGLSAASAQAQANVRLARQSDGSPGIRVKVESHASLLTGPVRPALVALQAASGLVLLLVCLNVGWLFAARARRLKQTFATMRALGATDGQVLATHLACALAVAVVAAPIALLLAWGLLRFGLTLESGIFSRTAEPAITWSVAVMALMTTLLAVAASCVPGAVTVTGSRGSLNSRSREQTRARLFERSLMATQVSLVFALAAQAILVALVLQSLVRTNVGFTKADFLVVSIQPQGAASIDPETQVARYNALVSELGFRGIRAAAAGIFPFTGSDFRSTFEPRPSRDHQRAMVRVRLVTASYFKVAGITATRGRLLTQDDLGARSIVVTDTFAVSVLPDPTILGRRVGGDYQWTIIGVAPPVRQFAVNEELQPEAYILYEDFIELHPDQAQRYMRGTYLLAETTLGVAATLQIVRNAVAEQLPEFRIRSAAPVADLIRSNLGMSRLVAAGSVVFSTVSLLMAAVGLYAMVSQGLALRGREIGVRMALGATAGRIAVDSARPICIVYVLGVCGGTGLLLSALSAIRAVAIPPPGAEYPPVVAVAAASAAVLFVVFAAACYGPIRGATGTDPAVSLRAE